jgi:PAS domain S-box-containing protein
LQITCKMIKKYLLKILFVEDLPSDVDLAVLELRKEGLQFEHIRVDTRSEFIKALQEFDPDIIISDYSMPTYNGMQAIKDAQEFDMSIPFILFTGSMNEETAVDCLKAGADDYIIKEHLTRLPFAVKEVLEQHRIQIEKRTSELLLKESEEKLQSIFSAAPVGIGLVVNRTYMEVNDTFCRMTGYSRNELIGKSSAMMYPSKEEFEIAGIEKFRQIADSGTGSVETRLKCKSGEILNIISTSNPLDPEDLSKGVIFTVLDITDRKLANNELLKLHSAFDSSGEAIFITDLDGLITDINPEFTNLYGFSADEVIGKSTPRILKSGTMAPERYISFWATLLKNEVVRGELINKTKDGKLLNIEGSANSIFNDRKEVVGFIGIQHDITARKLAEKELIKARDRAEESDRLKTAFLHNISHEIRTPMNAIVGFSSLLGEPDVDEQSRRNYIEMIMQSSDHLLAIISDIVDISNIEANLVKIVKNEININSTLKSLCNQFIPEATEKKVKIICENGLSDSDALILTDSTKVTQILLNLISNALKFTDIGVIKLWYRVKNHFLEFCVSDTGIGIPQESHNKIFDRFYQIQNSISRLYEGTGLGLTISKAYVELLGGKIWLSSEPGKGSSFFFTIPYEKGILGKSALNETRVPERLVFPAKKKILVAEDIDSNFKLICYFLSGVNAEIIRATNGKEAVEKCLSDQPFDLVLMDIKMPVMDGYTAVKQIRKTLPYIPIIAQTAYPEDNTYAAECGCTGFISKPFDKKNLLKVMAEFL